MKNIIKTTAIVVMMALSATVTFAQTSGSNNGGNSLPIYSIKVAITHPGANCPHNGTVTSLWKWWNGGTQYLPDVPGTTAYYTQVPWEGHVNSIHPGGSTTWQSVTEAGVNVKPTGHPEAHNGGIFYPPYNPNNPITLNPGTCNTGVGECEEVGIDDPLYD